MLKVTQRKVGVGLKRRWEFNKRRLGWRLAWWGSTEKKEALHLLGLRGRHQYSDQHSNRNRAPCVTSTTEDQMARSSEGEQLTEEGREAGRSLLKREKSSGPRTDPCGTCRRTRRNDFCDFDRPHKRTYLLFFLSTYSRLGVATADICIFYNMAFVLWSGALPATNPLFRGTTGPSVFHIKLGASR